MAKLHCHSSTSPERNYCVLSLQLSSLQTKLLREHYATSRSDSYWKQILWQFAHAWRWNAFVARGTKAKTEWTYLCSSARNNSTFNEFFSLRVYDIQINIGVETFKNTGQKLASQRRQHGLLKTLHKFWYSYHYSKVSMALNRNTIHSMSDKYLASEMLLCKTTRDVCVSCCKFF